MCEVNTVLNVHRNHKAYYGRGEVGKGLWRWGKREIRANIPLNPVYFSHGDDNEHISMCGAEY